MLLKVEQTSKLGKHGDRPLSFEEHTIRKWSRSAADTKEGGYGVFDTTLGLEQAAGLITSQVHTTIAYTAIKHSCDAVIESLRDTSVNVFQPSGVFQLDEVELDDGPQSVATTPSVTSESTSDLLTITTGSDPDSGSDFDLIFTPEPPSSPDYMHFDTQSTTYGQFSQDSPPHYEVSGC